MAKMFHGEGVVTDEEQPPPWVGVVKFLWVIKKKDWYTHIAVEVTPPIDGVRYHLVARDETDLNFGGDERTTFFGYPLNLEENKSIRVNGKSMPRKVFPGRATIDEYFKSLGYRYET